MGDAKLTPFQRRLLNFASHHGSVRGHQKATQMLGTNNPNLNRSIRLLRSRGLLGDYPFPLTDAGRKAIS